MITAPTLGIKTMNWTLVRQDQLRSSGWTGKSMVTADPWSARWKAHVDLATIQGESNARIIKSFIARCKGSTQAFRLNATAGPQNSNSGVTVSADAAQGATTMTISGASTPLLDGQMTTVNEQLLVMTADQSGSTLTFFPPLRQAATAGTEVVTSQPYCLVYMADSRNGWSIGQDRLFGVSFDVEEAINEGTGTGLPESSGALLMETGDHLLKEDGGFILLD